jgi:hypothetical protein
MSRGLEVFPHRIDKHARRVLAAATISSWTLAIVLE